MDDAGQREERCAGVAILTAARSEEVRGWARWREIGLEAALWAIPAQHMKAGREHRVSLSDESLALLRAVRVKGTSCFSGRKRGVKLSEISLTAILCCI